MYVLTVAHAPECPVEAIFEEDDLPDGQEHWVDINEERSQKLQILLKL